MPEPESQADALIVVGPLTPGGPLFIQLKGEKETVPIGPYQNPDLAYKDALKIRAFLAEVIRKAKDAGPSGEPLP